MKKILPNRLNYFLAVLISFISLTAFSQDLDVTFSPSIYNGGYNISCHGASDGSLEAVIVGGVSPYSFQWSTGAYTKIISGLPAGFYSFTVFDANNDSITKEFELKQSAQLTGSLDPTIYEGGYNITQQGGNDGKIKTSISGGATPYTYLWNNGETKSEIVDLYSGTYTVTVTDINQCAITLTQTMTQPTPLHIVSLQSPQHGGYNLSCALSEDGAINLTVAGGVSPYEFVWNNGRFTEDMTGLKSGEYTVQIKDANGVKIYGTIVLSKPNPIDVSLTPAVYPNGKNTSCFNCSNGSITTIVSGGVAPYTYEWSSGQTTANISGLMAGTYVLSITDANGCKTQDKEVALAQPDRDDWTMKGNTSSLPDSNFIGTTDNRDFVIRTNATERLRIKGTGIINSSSLSGTGDGILMVNNDGDLMRQNPSNPTISSIPWMLSGNYVGTNSFLGSLNNIDVVFKTNNTEQMVLKTSGDLQLKKFEFTPNGLFFNSAGYVDKINFTTGADVLRGDGTFGSLPGGAGYWNINGNHLYNTNTGRIGIGTNNPSQKLEVVHNDISGGIAINQVDPGSAVTSSEIKFNHNSIQHWAIGSHLSTSPSGPNSFFIWNNLPGGNALGTAFYIDGSTNNIGIGNITPTEKLEVSGKGKFTALQASGLGGNAGKFVQLDANGNLQSSSVSASNLGLWSFNGSEIYYDAGKVFIGMSSCGNCLTPGYSLYVENGIMAREIKVTATSPFPDYVFSKDYKLKGIAELEEFIDRNHHLPDMPSEKEVFSNNGYEIGDMMMKLLKKVEEQTLYILAQQKEIDTMKEQLNKMERR